MAGSWNGLTYNGDATNENVTGTSADEWIIGRGGNDTLRGAGGNDQLDGGEGNDTLEGGDGNDTLSAAYFNNLGHGGGLDTLDGERAMTTSSWNDHRLDLESLAAQAPMNCGWCSARVWPRP